MASKVSIEIDVTNVIVGYSYVRDYNGNPNNRFIVPTYRMDVSAWKDGKEEPLGSYEIIRFGIDNKGQGPYVEGMNGYTPPITIPPVAERPIDMWSSTIPRGPLCQTKGAWLMGPGWTGDQIHVGPTDPRDPTGKADGFVFGAMNCIEVCGKGQFYELRNKILWASGLLKELRDYRSVPNLDPRKMNKNLDRFAKCMLVKIQLAVRPPLLSWDKKDEFLQYSFPDLKGQEPPRFPYYPPEHGIKDSILDVFSCIFGGSPADAYEGPPSSCGTRDLAAPKTEGQKARDDPLVLDLDGDGIQTTKEGRSWEEGRAFFDLNADGFAERTGWVSGNDGLLVMDRNGDGIINNGRELFGDETVMSNGKRTHDSFRALADLDSNHDGRIDANDAAFSQLQIWKDEDEDGFWFPDELHTLSEDRPCRH